MSGKTIDIEAGDTFTVTDSGTVFIYRGDFYRCLDDAEWLNGGQDGNEKTITAAQFRTIAVIAGYTVVEKQPEAEAVVVTHGAESVGRPGCLMMLGTKVGVERWIADSTSYRLVRIRFGGASNG